MAKPTIIPPSGISGKLPGWAETLIPDDAEIPKLSGWGPIGIPGWLADAPGKIVNGVKNYGLVVKDTGKKANGDKTPDKPPKPDGGPRSYAKSDIDSLMDIYAFKELAKDAKATGYCIHYMSLRDLNKKFPHEYVISGYEEGMDIYLADDIPIKDILETLGHEVKAKDKRREYPWKTHDELHPDIFAEEQDLINSYRSRQFGSQRN